MKDKQYGDDKNVEVQRAIDDQNTSHGGYDYPKPGTAEDAASIVEQYDESHPTND